MKPAGAAAIVRGSAGVSATDVAPFLGEWTLALEGPNGPGTFTLSSKIEQEVIGEIASDAIGKQPITRLFPLPRDVPGGAPGGGATWACEP